jgi:hypothetical protein
MTSTTTRPAQLIIEICPSEPRASACLMNGDAVSSDPDVAEHLSDCTRSGDCEDACRYVVRHVGVEFRIMARNAASGEYENRLATADEKAATCRAIYFDLDSDFSDETLAEIYLVWEASHGVERRVKSTALRAGPVEYPSRDGRARRSL